LCRICILPLCRLCLRNLCYLCEAPLYGVWWVVYYLICL
jgi:hypothetical protein